MRLVRLFPAFVLAAVASLPAAAQTPTPAQIQQFEQLRNMPGGADSIRALIANSKLSPDEIRAKLQAAGLPSTALDEYLSPATSAAPSGEITDQTLQALSALVPSAQPSAVARLAVDSGPQAAAAAPGAGTGLQLFGTDVFRGRTTQFQPLLAGPVPPNYRVGPGDEIILVITGDVEFIHDLTVTREGFIVIPQVGKVSVASLTMDELRMLLRARLGRVYSGIKRGTTKFDVTIGKLRTNQVFVIGEVEQPGAYQLSSVATVLNALYAAGGPSDRGNFRTIYVRRGSRTVDTLDLYDYLLQGETKNDIVLQQGDVVFVPIHGTRVALTGAIKRPAIYELKDGETLADLIAAAGGFAANAAFDRIAVTRIIPPSQRTAQGPRRMVVDVPLHGQRTVPPFPMVPGDSVDVFGVPAAQTAVVQLNGAVYHPGTYGFHIGMTLSDLVRLAGGFRPAVYAGQATIARLNLADSTRYVVRVPLPADSTESYPNDIALADYDVVTVYSREDFRADRTVSIAGMVNNPGTFSYRNGMTLRDLVLMAHGLRDGAYLDSAEVARLPENRSHGQLAVIHRVPIDSSYLFEPDTTTYSFLPGLPSAPRGSAPEVPLKPFDHVLILKQPEFELQREAYIGGEVRFPGDYALTTKDERLSDLVERAGGLLPTAYAEGARLTRAVGNEGLVDIRLTRAMQHPGGADDLVLQPSDTIRVPEYDPVVRIQGAVNSPMSVRLQPGAGLSYYIANAGGYAQNADKSKVSVRYANGSARTRSKFLFFSSYPSPGPGSVVTVPLKQPGPPFDVTAFLGNLAQVLASSVAIVLLATKL